MLIRFLLLLLVNLQVAHAEPPLISVHLQDVYLPDAISFIAKWLHMNVMISPKVKGTISLELVDSKPEIALNLLLSSQGLGKWQWGKNCYIASKEELIHLKEEDLKWQASLLNAEHLRLKTWRIRYSNARHIARLFQEEHSNLLSDRGKVYLDERTNTLSVQDVDLYLKKVDILIKKLDVPIKQIAISARLISVDRDYEHELGVHFNTISRSEGKNNSHEGSGYSFLVAKLADGSWLDVKLSILEKKGHAELLSSPHLLTANQEMASIEAGEEVPYQEMSENGGTAIVFKKAVLGLKVEPKLLPNNRIVMKLQINQDRPSQRLVQGVPTISTRQMTTNVLVKADQTVVLGGIYELNQEKASEEIPFMSQLPVIGWLFRQQRLKAAKRELLIFVTPTIIS